MTTIQNTKVSGMTFVQQYGGQETFGTDFDSQDVKTAFNRLLPRDRVKADTVEISFRPVNNDKTSAQAVLPGLYNTFGKFDNADVHPERTSEKPKTTDDRSGNNLLAYDKLLQSEEHFKKADKNKDGKFNAEELNEEFKRLDSNLDLVVDPREFHPGSFEPPYTEFKNNRFSVIR